MTKKRHAKLMLAFNVAIREYAKVKGLPICTGKDIQRCVATARRCSSIGDMTREEFWRKSGAATAQLFGMTIKGYTNG